MGQLPLHATITTTSLTVIIDQINLYQICIVSAHTCIIYTAGQYSEQSLVVISVICTQEGERVASMDIT